MKQTLLLLLVTLQAGCQTPQDPNPMIMQYLNPEGLHRNPAFTQAISVRGPHRTLYIGGQNAVDASGEIVGPGDIAAQAEQVARNLQIALAAGGAELSDVAKWTIYIVDGQPARAAFESFMKVWGSDAPPPTISVVFVAGLAHPDFLLEVEGVAVVPEEE